MIFQNKTGSRQSKNFRQPPPQQCIYHFKEIVHPWPVSISRFCCHNFRTHFERDTPQRYVTMQWWLGKGGFRLGVLPATLELCRDSMWFSQPQKVTKGSFWPILSGRVKTCEDAYTHEGNSLFYVNIYSKIMADKPQKITYFTTCFSITRPLGLWHLRGWPVSIALWVVFSFKSRSFMLTSFQVCQFPDTYAFMAPAPYWQIVG